MTDTVKEALSYLAGCCLHDAAFGPDDVAEEVWVISEGEYGPRVKGWNFGPESHQWALVKLTDGDYGFVEASEDYTGHGCQCGSYAKRIGPDPEAVWDVIPEYERDEVRQAVQSLYATDTPS